MKAVCVYCGSSAGRRPEYAESARRLGGELVSRGLGLVYGGSSVGIMKVVADAVLERGGRVTGVIPEALVRKEIAHRGLTELHVTASMHERKMRMAELSDAFVALPGGIGTLEELFEAWTWGQLGLHAKPCGLLNVAGYWDGLTAFLAALTLTSYVFVYTPMKTRSPLSTIVGAVPGALPPLGGYTAAAGALGAPGLALFAILFLWQMPHFYAIGWRHRADYGAAGFRILSTVDPTGRSSARHALAFGLLLVPVSVLPTWLGTAGLVYGAGALLLSLWFAGTAVRFFRETTDRAAKSMFLASIAWLPAIVVLLLADRVTGG